jgi:hypothetical protein
MPAGTLSGEVVQLSERTAGQSPLEFFKPCRELLQGACAKGKRCDSGGQNYQEGVAAYTTAAQEIWKRGMFPSAVELLREWWDELGRRQQAEKRYIYKAMAAVLLSQTHLFVQQHGIAFRWALLTHADDILGSHPEGGGAGRDLLRAQFGIGQTALDSLTDLAHKYRGLADAQRDGWKSPVGFAEGVVQRFSMQNPAYAQQIAELTAPVEFPLSPAYFSALLDEVKRDDGSSTERGDRLETAAYYLFSLLSGCLPQKTTIDRYNAFESDIIVRNVYKSSSVVSELFGRHVLVECKNWTKRVRVQPVGYFLFRMKMTHSQLGVIFSRAGITGGVGRNNARSLIQRNYHEDGTNCIVLDMKDLQRLARGEVGFFWLLLEKVEEFRFGKPKAEGGERPRRPSRTTSVLP